MRLRGLTWWRDSSRDSPAGHNTIAVSGRYFHPSEDAVLAAVSRLRGHIPGHTGDSPSEGREARLLTS